MTPFIAVGLLTLAVISPSFVAGVAVLLMNRNPSYLLAIITISTWTVSVALYMAALYTIPWSTFSSSQAVVLELVIGVASIAHILTAIWGISKVFGADFRSAEMVSSIDVKEKTQSR